MFSNRVMRHKILNRHAIKITEYKKVKYLKSGIQSSDFSLQYVWNLHGRLVEFRHLLRRCGKIPASNSLNYFLNYRENVCIMFYGEESHIVGC